MEYHARIILLLEIIWRDDMQEPLDEVFIGALYLSDNPKTYFVIIGRKGSLKCHCLGELPQ